MDHRAPDDFTVYAGDAPSGPLELDRSEQVRAAAVRTLGHWAAKAPAGYDLVLDAARDE